MRKVLEKQKEVSSSRAASSSNSSSSSRRRRGSLDYPHSSANTGLEEQTPLLIRSRQNHNVSHEEPSASSSSSSSWLLQEHNRSSPSVKMGSLLFATTCGVAFVSAFISHFVTVYLFYASSSSSVRYSSSLSLLLKQEQKRSSQAKINNAQQFASESFRIYLLEPSLQCEELYYNSKNDHDGADMDTTTKHYANGMNQSDTDSSTTVLATKERREEEPTTTTTSSSNTNVTLPPHPPPENCETTLMLLRHCEGGVAREHCGYMGYQRSQYLATLFGNDGKWPAPSYIFAMSAGERHNPVVQNWREIETVQPLADKFNMTIDVSYGFPEKKQLMEYLYSLLRTSAMCGKLAVLSWKHHDIPHFSHGMGCGPDQGCPMSFGDEEYDKVWQIKYSYHRQLHAPYVVEDNSTRAAIKKRQFSSWGKYPQWFVYGTVRSETFDPLQFSAARGIYMENKIP